MKFKIETLVFVCGFVLMALEMSAARLLVFDYGGTYIVWGSILTIIMSGLGLGYYFGGYLADSVSRNKMFSTVIFLSAISIFIIPFVYPRLVELFANINPTYAPLLVSCFIFLIPSILLGCVSPIAIRLSTKQIKNVGKVSGRLWFISTIGNVVGVLVATFILIMFLPLNYIFILLSLILLGTLLFCEYRKTFIVVIALIFMIALTLVGSPTTLDPDMEILHEEGEVTFESLYGPVKVSDNNGIRTLHISSGSMGAINGNHKFRNVEGEDYFYRMVDLIASMNPDNVLMLGVGAGIVPSRLNEIYGISVDGVDINGVVLDVAVKYFGLVPSDTLKLHTQDARMYLKNSDKRYDVIAMDTFNYINGRYVVPPHLATKEYYQLAKSHLSEDGALVVLLVNGKEDEFVVDQVSTLMSVFEFVYIFTEENIVVATDKELIFSSYLMQFQREIQKEGMVYTDNFTPIIN